MRLIIEKTQHFYMVLQKFVAKWLIFGRRLHTYWKYMVVYKIQNTCTYKGHKGCKYYLEYFRFASVESSPLKLTGDKNICCTN